MGWAKVPLVYTLSDETFSIVSSVEPPEGIGARDFYLAVPLLRFSGFFTKSEKTSAHFLENVRLRFAIYYLCSSFRCLNIVSGA